MNLTSQDLARLIDLSAVRAECDEDEVRELAATARRFGVVCVFALPCHTRLLASLLADAPQIGIGGVVGFPSGAHTTAIKVAEARQLLADGATELDMVINIGLLRGGNDQAVREDIRAVVNVAGGVPVKVILECHWLTPGQIRRGSELCVEAGAAWIKTGTGGIKASLYASDGQRLASVFVGYDTFYPQVSWHEQRPEDWWSVLVSATRQLLGSPSANAAAIQCLAISGHSLGCVPLDQAGRLLCDATPIWSDRRAEQQTVPFFNKIDPAQWYLTTGNGFPAAHYAVFKVLWYRDHMPRSR